jgi:DNA-binding transcriptional LysR family regulator
MYTPQSRPGLNVELLLNEELILVSTDGADAGEREDLGPGYIFIDWGPEFFAKHNAVFPEFTGPALSTNVGWLGLQHILEHGGAGYFPRRLIAGPLASRRLVALPDAPAFQLPAYLVYPLERDESVFGPALDVIRRIATS